MSATRATQPAHKRRTCAHAAGAGETCPAPGSIADPRVAAALAAVSGALLAVIEACRNRGGCPNEQDTKKGRTGMELHHIVAQTAPLAAPARAILVKVHVGINSAENTVLLPYTFHRRLHTTAVGSIRRQRS